MEKNTEHEKPTLRHILVIAIFLAIIGVFFILNFAVPAPGVLISERRAPATLPAFNVNNLANASWMDRFEDYAADRFVFRDTFRTVRAATVFGPLLQTDKNGLFFGASGAGEFQKLDPVSGQRTANIIKQMAGTIQGCNIYYTIVPDKSLYAGKFLPGFVLPDAEAIFNATLSGYTYIPLKDSITSASFYRTDIHWDQSQISAVVSTLASAMGAAADLSGYTEQTAGNWHGIYNGQLALPMAPDVMTYLTSPTLTAKYLNPATQVFEDGPVYDLPGFAGLDPYDIFLSGAQPVIELDNPGAGTQRTLYIFRDSFGSSLGPLIASAYSKVVLIDLRYIDARILDQFVTFTPGSDVLFMYSSQILNNPSVLRGAWSTGS